MWSLACIDFVSARGLSVCPPTYIHMHTQTRTSSSLLAVSSISTHQNRTPPPVHPSTMHPVRPRTHGIHPQPSFPPQHRCWLLAGSPFGTRTVVPSPSTHAKPVSLCVYASLCRFTCPAAAAALRAPASPPPASPAAPPPRRPPPHPAWPLPPSPPPFPWQQLQQPQPMRRRRRWAPWALPAAAVGCCCCCCCCCC